LTESGMVLGTPSYMAPEQAAGRNRDLGPAADIYSLGAMLYETLTGRPPHVGTTALETLQQTLTCDPLPPRRLQPSVPRDLETICLKCLHKDPQRRYPSAQDLADDLRRFLRGEPIRARPTPSWERALKWARRRPTAAALLAVSVLAGLALFLVGVAYNAQLREERDEADRQRRRAEHNAAQAIQEKKKAEANFQLARRVVDGYTTRLTEGEHLRAEDLRKELLQLARTYYQQFIAQRGSDPVVRAANGWSHLHLAKISGDLGAQEGQALDLCRKGVAIFEELHRQYPDRPAFHRYLAYAYFQLGRTYRDISRFKEGEEALRHAYQIQQKLLAERPDGPLRLRNLARTCFDLGLALHALGRGTATIYNEGLSLLDRLEKKQPLTPNDLRTRASILEGLGILDPNHPQRPQARAAFTRALAIREKLAADNPGASYYQDDAARCYLHLATTYPPREATRALELLHKARAIGEKLVREHPGVTLFAVDLGACYWTLGKKNKEPAARADWYSQAIQVLQRVRAREPRHIQGCWMLSRSHMDRARALQQLGRYPEALPDWAKAVEVLDSLKGLNPDLRTAELQLNQCYVGRAWALNALGRHPEALAEWAKAIQVLEGIPADHLRKKEARRSLGLTYLGRTRTLNRLERFQEALTDLERAEKQDRSLGPQLRLPHAETLVRLGLHARALDLATQVAPATPQQQVELARVYALAVRAAGTDRRLAVERRKQLADSYAGQAVSWLKQARAAGQFPTARDRDRLKHAPDFAALRERTDFQQLVGGQP
jgi:tetratricopeptide (TPR) repeat protein